MAIYIKWERPRHWRVRLYKDYKNNKGGYHSVIGVIADSVDRAIEAAQNAFPDSRIDSCNDYGGVDIIVDSPVDSPKEQSQIT